MSWNITRLDLSRALDYYRYVPTDVSRSFRSIAPAILGRLTAAALVALVLLFVACGGGGGQPSDTPDASPTVEPQPTAATTPTTGPLTCADHSTERFEEMATKVTFTLYCPTFLPDGFILSSIEKKAAPTRPGSVPNPSDVFVSAVFADADGREVTLLEGVLGVQFEGTISQLHKDQESRTVPYGDINATFYPSFGSEGAKISGAVLARSVSITVRYFITGDLDDETLAQVSAAMRAVGS